MRIALMKFVFGVSLMNLETLPRPTGSMFGDFFLARHWVPR